MAETIKGVIAKKTTKKTAKKAAAAPKKKKPEDVLEDLFKAVEAAREAGYTVRINTSRMNEDGVSEERN